MSQPQSARAGDVYPPSAADHEARRERDKVVGQGQDQRDGSLHVTETDLPAGKRLVTASAGGQVMSQFTVPVPDRKQAAEATDAVTVGEALQAAARAPSVGGRPVGPADAAAMQAAEMRATGLGVNVPGGVAAAAQRAAERNMKAAAAEEGGSEAVRIRDVLGDATAALPADKVATREDAKKVAAAAARNQGKWAGAGGGSGGVVDAVAAAADANKGRMK